MPSEPLTDRHRDIAAALQERLEEVVLHLARQLYAQTKLKKLCLAGGVALLWQAKPSLKGNIDQTETIFEHSAQHLVARQTQGVCRGPSSLKDNTFGFGLLNLLQAVQSN